MTIKKEDPFYPIGMAAQKIGIGADRLRTYEDEGLIKPYRKDNKQNGKRLFSEEDIEWIIYLRKLMQDKKISTSGLRIILKILPYWRYINSNEDLAKSFTHLNDDEDLKILEKLIEHPSFNKLFND